ncbi:MAG: hypothetical protein NTX36_12245 [Proteobacteria bacterium]|nr:hypothetical protein [Pseudomonadota bacterium]
MLIVLPDLPLYPKSGKDISIRSCPPLSVAKQRKGFRRQTMKTLLLLFLFFCPDIAHAYLDPGTGSYILQVLLAVVIGGLFSIKVFWKKIKALFIRSATKENKDKE